MERSRTLVVLAVAATLAVAAAVVVWLLTRDDPAEAPPVASASATSPTAPPSTSPPDVTIGGTPGPELVTGPPSISDDVEDLAQFSSPTGNIGCVVSTEFAVCEIGQYEFPLPPKPADCRGDWAATFELTEQSPVPTVGACQTDTQLGSPDQLAYGSTTVVGDFACLSQDSGMTCWNPATGHGFTVSRAAYALF